MRIRKENLTRRTHILVSSSTILLVQLIGYLIEVCLKMIPIDPSFFDGVISPEME